MGVATFISPEKKMLNHSMRGRERRGGERIGGEGRGERGRREENVTAKRSHATNKGSK